MCISSLGSEETVLLPSMPWKDVVHTTCIARTGCMDDIFAMAADRNAYGYFLLGISCLWWLSFERDGFPEGRLSLAFLVCSPGTQGNRDRSRRSCRGMVSVMYVVGRRRDKWATLGSFDVPAC